MITHLDHIYTYLRDNDLEKALDRAARAGFNIMPARMRHPAGNLNGFAEMTGTYLEFISIVDESEYEAEANAEDRVFRKDPGPYAAGAVCLDPDLIYQRLSPLFPNLKPPYSRGEKGKADGPIRWSFCPLPIEATPGCDVFPLKYHLRAGKPYVSEIGRNSIFGMTGLVFCTEAVSEKMDTWEKTLSSLTSDFFRSRNELRFGVQTLTWLTPSEYREQFGAPWLKRESASGDLASVKLGAVSMDIARAMLEAEGFRFTSRDANSAVSTRDFNTGLTFTFEQGDAGAFLEGLNRMAGV